MCVRLLYLIMVRVFGWLVLLGDLGADGRTSRPVRVGPLAGDQAAVPAQDGAGGDQPVHPQPSRQKPDQRSQDRAVGPVRPGPRMGPAQHGDLVP